MYTPEALLDFHARAQHCLQRLLAHCGGLTAEELDRTLPGFGYPTVRLQVHHLIGAQEYWLGVLHGNPNPEDNAALYPTVEALASYRVRVAEAVETYLRSASEAELNRTRPLITWGGKEQQLTPAPVILRTITHIFHHQGQVLAMCRLLGKPGSGMDLPL